MFKIKLLIFLIRIQTFQEYEEVFDSAKFQCFVSVFIDEAFCIYTFFIINNNSRGFKLQQRVLNL